MELQMALKLSSGRRVKDTSQIEKCRETVCDFIGKCLDRVEQESEWKLLLGYMKETRRLCPEAFICSVSPRSKPPAAEHAFVLWLFSCLLGVLPQTESGEMEESLLEFLHSILQLAKSRDHPLFCYLLQEFVTLVSDAVELGRVCVGGGLQFPVFLSHFQFSWGQEERVPGGQKGKEGPEEVPRSSLQLEPQLVELQSPNHLASLQLAVLRLLAPCVDDVCQFCSREVPTLLQVVNSSIQYGGLEIKKQALLLLEALLLQSSSLSRPSLDHTLWSLIALLSLLTNRHLAGESVPECLELALVGCLRVLFSPSEGEPLAVRRFWDPLLVSLQASLLRGAYPKCCQEMQRYVGELLFKCSLVATERNAISAAAIVQNIGKTSNLQPLVACLCHLLRSEAALMKGSHGGERGKELGTEHFQAKRPKIDSGKKLLSRKLSKGSKGAKVGVISVPSLAIRLAQKALDCARHASTLCTAGACGVENSELLCTFEGVRVVLEVFSRLFFTSEVVPSPWVTVEQLGVVCQSWEGSLCSVVTTEGRGKQELLDKVLSHIVESAVAVMLLAANVPVSPVILDRCLWFIGLPWPQSSSLAMVEGLVAGSSLSVQQCQQVREAITQLCDGGVSCKIASLHALAALPPLAGDSQKLNGFLLALADPSLEVQVAAVRSLAAAMASLEREAVSSLAEALLTKLTLESEEVQLAVAKELPCILFAVSVIGLPRKFCVRDYTVPLHHTCAVKIPSLSGSSSSTEVRLDTSFLSSMMELLPMTSCSPVVVLALVESFALIAKFLDDPTIVSSKCLPLLTHESQQVRGSLSHHMDMFFPDPSPSIGLAELEQVPVVRQLRESYRTAARDGNVRLQEFIVTVFGQIGRFANGTLLVMCLITLLKLFLEPSPQVKAASYVQLQGIASAHNLTPLKLLSQFREPICQFLVDLLHNKKDLALTEDKKSNLLQQIALAFNIKELKQFFESIRDTLVPLLVFQATPESSEALKFLAKNADSNVKSMLVECFRHIFLHLVKNGQQEDLNTASRFLKEEAEFEMTTLLRMDTKNVLNLLLLHLSSHRERVLAGIRMLVEVNFPVASTESKASPLNSDQRIPEYLEPHLHGVVAYLNFTLIRLEYFENSSKGKLAISSLIELMRLMGPKYITHVKMKVIAILRHCLAFKDEEVTKLTLSAWNVFICSVELESLGPLLGQIVVALSPFIETHSQIVAEIFEFLITENRKALAPYFSEIYMMPESPALADVNAVLKEYSRERRSFHQKLQHLLKGICHERSDVRLHALKALHKLLKLNQVELEKCMVGSDTVDPVITDMVKALLKGLRGASLELREEYGKCLGELGAIDPGRLDIPIASSSKAVKFFEINGDFAVDLLGELAWAYLAATDTRSQDCCAYAIQEVLRIFDCGNTNFQSDGADVWSSISSDCQEVLRPHLNSSYSATVPLLGKQSIPIFKATKNVTFQEWIQKWCTFLIHKLGDSLPKNVFLPCSLLFQHDISLALYILPYVLVCALQPTTPDVMRQVHTEVMAVLNHSAYSRDLTPEHADSTSMCSQTVFTTLDHLTAWVSGKRKAVAARKIKGYQQKGNPEEVERVTMFLDSIPKDVLATSAFRCQAYTRALMYLESYLRANPDNLQKNLGFLQRIYVALDEPDGVAGVAAVRSSEPTLTEQTLQSESTGNYRDAAACYERAVQLEPNEVSYHEGLLRCMMRQGEFTSALMHVCGLQKEKPEWMQRLNAFRVEAAWKLGQWDNLEQYLKMESVSSKNWDVNLGRLLLAAKQSDLGGFQSRLSKVRSEQMGPLSTASLEQGSYQRGYEYIVRLHMLQEMEEGTRALLNFDLQQTASPMHSILCSWQTRFQLTQESFRTQEPILSLRRVILGLESSKFEKEIGKYWLQSASIARRAGHLQTSRSFLLNASDYSLPEFCMEKAEWMRNQGGSHDALLGLQKAVAEQWPEVVTINLDGTGESATRNTTHSKALLLIGQWMEDTAHYDTQTVLKQYKSAISVHPTSEDGHFYLGKYYDRLKSVLTSDRPSKSAEFLQFIIRHYGHALEYGSKYIYQCMPRMLTLWLDFGSNVPDTVLKKSQEKSALKQTVTQLNNLMHTMTERLPPYQFLIAFSQLISRICHPNSDVFAQLEAIILILLKHYPQQSLWMMIAVSKSTHPDRQKRCRRILNRAKEDIPHIGKLIDDMVKLSDKLLEVSNKFAEPAKNYSMDKLCRGLTRLTNSSDFSPIMVPLQSSLTVTLPAGHGTPQTDHDPFPGIQPTILRFDDKVEVLASLQRPKKVTVLASDGNSYILLCKPKDDLRKDARLMEFNTLVNKCLRKDQECRQRRLYIRTYAVIPLNEECGLLEWVPNTHGMRNILLKIYQEKGFYVSGRELRDMIKTAQSDPEHLKDVYLNKLLPKHPPVFGEWFLRTFPDPTAWYSSRLSYAHTAAVMSMVGYILGLGDRHGENILFDSTNGDCFHVDFNCLFNRGETFDVPEVVPFRLTQNMIHGLGVTGFEGGFRKSCEVTMKVMRQECDALICVLRTFIHDPLVEWGKVKGKQASMEATNEKAIKIVKDIEDRLHGKYSKAKGLPLSIEGHVHALIKEATDVDNLSRMYIGWAAYL